MKRIARLIALITIILLTSYALCLISAGSFILDTDTYAPYLAVKSTLQDPNIELKDFPTARIPSLVPDIAILASILKQLPNANYLQTVSIYTVTNGCALLLAQIYFIMCIKKRKSILRVAILMCLIWIGLAAYLPLFRESVGTALTPVRHGGNIVLIYLLGGATLRLSAPRETVSNAMFDKFFAYTVCAIGTSSNLLFIPSAVIPAISTIGFVNYKNRISARLSFFSTAKSTLFMLLGVVTGWLMIRILRQYNMQCDMPTSINLQWSISKLIDVASRDGFSNLCLMLASIALFILAINLHSRSRQGNHLPANQYTPSLVYAGVSAFSPVIYTALMADAGALPVRYILPLILAFPPIIFIALSHLATLFQPSRDFFKSSSKTVTFSRLETILLILSLLNLPLLLNDKLAGAALFNKVNQNWQHSYPLSTDILKFLTSKRLNYGLSDFWGSQYESNINGKATQTANRNNMNITIEPILSSGEPDLWAHGKNHYYQRHDSSHHVNKYQFILSISKDFTREVASNFKFLRVSKKEENPYLAILLIDKKSSGQIQSLARKKLSTYTRNCNANSIR